MPPLQLALIAHHFVPPPLVREPQDAGEGEGLGDGDHEEEGEEDPARRQTLEAAVAAQEKTKEAGHKLKFGLSQGFIFFYHRTSLSFDFVTIVQKGNFVLGHFLHLIFSLNMF